MEISRRADYAIRIVLALASSDGEPLSVRLVADEQDVPHAFARSIQHELVLAGLVTSKRGAHGGMVLARPADELTLLDVVEGVQGPISVSVCAREENWCPRDSYCQVHRVWKNADNLLRGYLGSITIKQLIDSSNGLQLCSDDGHVAGDVGQSVA